MIECDRQARVLECCFRGESAQGGPFVSRPSGAGRAMMQALEDDMEASEDVYRRLDAVGGNRMTTAFAFRCDRQSAPETVFVARGIAKEPVRQRQPTECAKEHWMLMP